MGGILDHERKRKLEVKCMELEEVLEEQGYAGTEIEEKVTAYRKMLLSKEVSKKAFTEVDEFGRPVLKETHQIAEAQKEKNKQLKEAFGISEYFVEGSSFDPNRRALEEAARDGGRPAAGLDEDTRDGKKEKKRKKKKKVSSSESESEDSEDERRRRKEKKKNKKRSRSRSVERRRRGRSEEAGRKKNQDRSERRERGNSRDKQKKKRKKKKKVSSSE